MTIDVSITKKAIELIFAQLEAAGISVIDIEDEYYWEVSKRERYQPYHKPTEFELGQISDDLQELSKIVNGSSEPNAFALVWAASVLRRIGETIVS
jgi:hypothetical protein